MIFDRFSCGIQWGLCIALELSGREHSICSCKNLGRLPLATQKRKHQWEFRKSHLFSDILRLYIPVYTLLRCYICQAHGLAICFSALWRHHPTMRNKTQRDLPTPPSAVVDVLKTRIITLCIHQEAQNSLVKSKA